MLSDLIPNYYLTNPSTAVSAASYLKENCDHGRSQQEP